MSRRRGVTRPLAERKGKTQHMPGVLHEAVRGPNRSVEPEEDETLDLYRVLVGAWDAKWIVVAGIVAAVMAAAAGSALLPKVYQATATVLITPPTFSTDLKPQPLSVEAYARLAESDLVRDRVRETLLAGGFFTDGPKDLTLRAILYSSREPEQPYLPLVGLLAEWDTAEGAQKIANTWATLLIKEQERIATMTGAQSVTFITTEYPQAASDVAAAEQAHAALQATQAGELARARMELGVDPEKPQDGGLFFEQAEGALALRVSEGDRGPKYARMQAQEAVVLRLDSELARHRLDIELAKNRVEQLEAELKRTPQYLADAGRDAASAPVNPVYITLSEQLATGRVQWNALVATAEVTRREADAARTQAASLRQDLLTSESKLSSLQREHEVALARSNRKIAEAYAKLKPLEERIGAARLAQAQTEPDVKLGALAPLPLQPIRPDLKRNVLMATGIGLLLGLVAAWIVRRSADARA
jgi:uncharacterized protein involved in exopolysaccharide biosynthesis